MRSSIKNWLDLPVISHRGRAERRQVSGLVAYHTEGASLQPDLVRNISASGLYLVTATRWVIGSPIDLTLQRQGRPEEYAENRILLRAKAVRWGEDGVGLSFQHSKGTAVHLWDGKLRNSADPIEPVDVVRQFRVARAEAFLRRVCPSMGDRTSAALRNDVGSFRTESVIEIALRAEHGMPESESGRKLIHPEVLRQILENGSWADLDWTRELWANLLISACSAAVTDRASLQFTSLMSQMNVNQTRLLNWVCEASAQQMIESGATEPEAVAGPSDQLKQATGIGDLVRVEREVDHLVELGLLKSRPRSSYFDDEDDLTLCPTAMGMEFFTRSRSRQPYVPPTLSAAGMTAATPSQQVH